MNLKCKKLTELAHDAIKRVLQPGAIAIDATLGNGYDTLFLAELVGNTGHVYGFDIQESAISATQQRLKQLSLLTHISLFKASHANMSQLIPLEHHGTIQAIMFNLGYLPGGNKQIITTTDSTLSALTVGFKLLAISGVMTVIAYPGHPGGDEEFLALISWVKQLQNSKQLACELFDSESVKQYAPKLFVIRKYLNSAMI